MQQKIIKEKIDLLKLEVRELLGMLSVMELATNLNLAKRFQKLCEDF